MATFILVVGVFNFVLGYVLALAIADPPFLGILKGSTWQNLGQKFFHLFKRAPLESLATDLDAAEPLQPHDQGNALPAVATFSETPELWQQVLRDDELQLDSWSAGIAHYLRLEGAIYREHLLTAEARARQLLAVQNPLAMEQLAADLRFINVDWTRKQHLAADLIEERTGRLGLAEGPALQLANWMRDQVAQIAGIDQELHALNYREEGIVACRRLLAELQQLIHLAHLLRETLQGSLAAIYHQEGTLKQLDRKLHFDPATGLLGRLGVENLFANVFPTGSRPTSAMKVSIDRFGKINQRLGARPGDQVLQAVGQFTAELLATKCERSMLARLAGCDFLVLANEATPEDLSFVGEHIRQSFEGAAFTYQGTDFSLSLTISVAAVATDASLSDVLNRLDSVSAIAVKAGRNRCARWENGAAILTLPPAIPVPARLITVDAAAA